MWWKRKRRGGREQVLKLVLGGKDGDLKAGTWLTVAESKALDRFFVFLCFLNVAKK